MVKDRAGFSSDTGGYGFISTDDAGDDMSFHIKDVGGLGLEESREVGFSIEQTPKNPRTTDVTRL